MKRLRSAFVTGLLVCVPLLATLDILVWFVRAVDDSIRNYLPGQLGYLDFRGSGLILAIALILLTGALTQNYAGVWLISVLDGAIRRVPLGGGIYAGIKKFLETIFNPSNDQFKEAVLVQFPRAGIYSIGFRTGHPDAKLEKAAGGKFANIFVPCTPNPTAGFYLLVREEELIPLDLPVPEAFKIVISMGIVTSEA
jgi:uncharacterized membrane protein